jgi:hypothetical protein
MSTKVLDGENDFHHHYFVSKKKRLKVKKSCCDKPKRKRCKRCPKNA